MLFRGHIKTIALPLIAVILKIATDHLTNILGESEVSLNNNKPHEGDSPRNYQTCRIITVVWLWSGSNSVCPLYKLLSQYF